MSYHDLPIVLTADDQNGIERELAELPESSDGARTISAIGRASQAARLRRNDTYPGEWDCGGVYAL